jgi:membrane protease YdiL (CAAX protease family)
METPARAGQHAVERSAPPGYCAYCGARLDPVFYFCLTCATPYKRVEKVLPRLRPRRLTDGELVDLKAPHVAPLFWTYFAVVVGVAVLCYVLFQMDRPGLALLFQTAALFVTTCIFASIHWRALVVQLKRLGFLRVEALLALVMLVPLLIVNYIYHGWVIRALGLERSWWIQELRESGLGQPTLIALVCVFPAVVEEIAFRGLVQHWLQVAIRPMRAVLLASALFTVLHFSVLSAPYLFAAGMLLGWAKWKTGSLYPSMLIHFLHNLIVLEFFRF